MEENLLEFADCSGLALKIDRNRGVVRGVKILGLESRNGRRYAGEAVARAAELYEGAKVNVNHPKGNPAAPRDYQDRIGVIRNVRFTADRGLFGDLHYNAEHALAGQLEWDAAHAPENVGLSHNVLARTTRTEQGVVVEAITRVVSVDLVLYILSGPERAGWALKAAGHFRNLLSDAECRARLATDAVALASIEESAAGGMGAWNSTWAPSPKL